MKQIRFALFFLIFIAACVQESPNVVVMTAVSTPLPTSTQTVTAVPIPAIITKTPSFDTPTPDELNLPLETLKSPPTHTPMPHLTPTRNTLSIQPPPAGLVYGDSDGLWKVVTDGELQRLWTHGNVTMSPNGQRALYQDESALKIADFVIGRESTLDLALFDQWCCAVWGGNDLILLGTLSEGEEWEQSFGHLTAVAADGSWQRVLDPENVHNTPMALSPDGRTIAYGSGRLVQLDGQVSTFDPTQFTGFPNSGNIGLGSPAWSPDGTKLAWYIAGNIGENGGYAAAIAVFDLEAETADIIHPYENLGRGGWFNAPVWSPDGKWLAFNAEADDLSKNGVWIIAADGTEEHFLSGLGGRNYIWSPDGQRLVYSVWDPSKEQDVVLMTELGDWTTTLLNILSDAVMVYWAPDGLPLVPPPPQVYCPDPQVGMLIKNDFNTVYINPILGIELTSPNMLCVHEPDYLFDSYGFTLADPEVWEGALLSVDWLYQSEPDQLEAIVQQTIDSYPELDIVRETITVDGLEGVMLWPLPGTEATTQIYVTANDRLYQLIFWSAPLDEQAQTLLDSLHFVEPTQSLDSLDLSDGE